MWTKTNENVRSPSKKEGTKTGAEINISRPPYPIKPECDGTVLVLR